MKQLDFTRVNDDGFTEGLYVSKYYDGEALVRIYFEGLSHSEKPIQDEAEAWLSREQVRQLIETLDDEDV